MNDFTVLRLRDGLTVVPFDTSAREQEYVAILPDGRHYRLTSRLQQLVECIDGHCTMAGIATVLGQKWQRPVHPKQVWEMAERYLAPNGLLGNATDSVSRDRPESVFSWRVKLLSPRHTLPVTRVGQYLFTWPAAALSLVIILLVHVVMYLQLDSVDFKLLQALGNGGLLLVYGLVMASVLIHEIGHASACRRFGEEYGDIGFALYLIFPVFYADVTRIWKLSRRQRVAVDLGGMYFQLLVAVLYYLLYYISGNWLWLLAVVQIDILVLLSFNPIAKFDGYWIVSDLMGVPNLHRQSVQMVRRLLGRSGVAKIALKPATQAWLWVYMLLSSGVIVLLLGLSLVYAPETAQQFAAIIADSSQTISHGWQTSDVGMIGTGLVQLVPPFFTMLGIFLLLLRALRSTAKRMVVKREVQATLATTDPESHTLLHRR